MKKRTLCQIKQVFKREIWPVPLTNSFYAPDLFIFGNFGVVAGPQILDISLRTPLGPSTSLPPLPVTPVIVWKKNK